MVHCGFGSGSRPLPRQFRGFGSRVLGCRRGRMERLCRPLPLWFGTLPHPRDGLVRVGAYLSACECVGFHPRADGAGCGHGSAAVFPPRRYRARRARRHPAWHGSEPGLCVDNSRCNHRVAGADRVHRFGSGDLERACPANFFRAVAGQSRRDRPRAGGGRGWLIYRFAALWSFDHRKARYSSLARRGGGHGGGHRRLRCHLRFPAASRTFLGGALGRLALSNGRDHGDRP